jgi:5'-nucleotidase
MKDLILITNPKLFEEKKNKFIQGGASSLQIVADFDKTLTSAFYHGEKANTAIAQLRNHTLLGEDYAKKAFDLFNQYHPIELDSTLSIKEKIPLMEEWWSKHLQIIVQYGMSRKVVGKVITIQSKFMRKSFRQLFKILADNKIPILVLSSGLGDVIEGMLKKKRIFTKNIHIISNYFDFDKEGKAIGYKGKIIHVFNKDESQIKGTPHFERILSRKNVILLGDSLGDLKMVGQIKFDEIIKIGFLEENVDGQLEEFKKNFDVILLGDSSLDFVNKLIQDVSSKNRLK